MNVWDIRRLSVTIGVTSVALGFLLLLTEGKSESYEPSVFAQYPLVFWVLLFSSYAAGVIVTIVDSRSTGRRNFLGPILVILGNSLFLIVPYVLGYYAIDPQDSTLNIGYVNGLVASGHAFPGDFYPGYHVLLLSASLVTQLPPGSLELLSVPALDSVYLLGILFFCRRLKFNRQMTYLFFILASPLIYPEVLVSVPRTFLFSLFPWFLAVLIGASQSRSGRSLILAVLGILLFTVSHPLNGGPTLFIPSALLVTYFAPRIPGEMKSKTVSPTMRALGNSLSRVMLVWITVWIAWVLQSTPLEEAIRQLSYGIGNSYLNQTTSAISSSGLPLYFILEILLKEFGPELLYVCVGLLLATMVVLFRSRIRYESASALLLASVALAILPWLAYSFVSPLNLTFWRFTPYLILPAAGLIALVIGRTKRTTVIVLLVAFVCIIQALAMASAFPSSWTSTVNESITSPRLQGISWFATHEITSVPVYQVSEVSYYPTIFALEGEYFPTNNLIENLTPPVHLKYTVPPEANGAYILLPAHAGILYQTKFPQFPSAWRFTETDVMNLTGQENVDIVYSNGAIQILAQSITSTIS